MPRILIMHASFGTGHLTAARALAAAFALKRAGQVQVVDALDFGGKLLRNALSRTYLTVSSKTPPLYRAFYEGSDLTDPALTRRASRWRGRLERPFVARLVRYVDRFKPDILIATHFLPVEVLQDRKLSGRLRALISCVITDFMVHSNWLNEAVDDYYLASAITREAMIARGVPAARLHVSGIPVDPSIAEPKAPEAMRARHDLAGGGPVVTLFGSGIEARRVRRIVAHLLTGTAAGTLVVVAGRNAEVAGALSDLADGPRMRLRTLGMIDYVDDLVAASDLVITKPGGLIVSEVLARGTPLLIVDPIPGQEEWNADFAAGCGAGIQVRQAESVPPTVVDLLDHPERLAMMRAQARRVGRPRAALDIAEQVLAAQRSR